MLEISIAARFRARFAEHIKGRKLLFLPESGNDNADARAIE